MSRNAIFETPPDPNAPFDYNAVPEKFYFDCEAVGSMPVRHVVEQGLDILVTNLAKVIEGVDLETGGGDEDDEADQGQGQGLVEPNMTAGVGAGVGANGDGYGGWGNGMSPLRR